MLSSSAGSIALGSLPMVVLLRLLDAITGQSVWCCGNRLPGGRGVRNAP